MAPLRRTRLKSRLPEITGEIGKRVDRAIEDVADGITERAKARVPVFHGDLKASIHTEQRSMGQWAVVAGDEEGGVFYGHLVELGTVHSPPEPFLIPATAASLPDIVRAVPNALRTL